LLKHGLKMPLGNETKNSADNSYAERRRIGLQLRSFKAL